MPKDTTERIIDWPYSSARAGGSVSVGAGGGGGGGGATNLDALTDVTLSAPANGQVLVYNSASGQWANAASPGALTAHALSGAFHTGLLNWSLINFTGSSLSNIATRPHSALTGIGPNDHHNQAHVLATGTALGADHTISGAAVGEVLRALTATTAAFDVLQHTDLGNILPDQHHTRVHNIITGDASGTVHTITGSLFQLVGATATNVLGLLTPSSAPGANDAILRTDANGGIQLDTNLLYVDAANNWVGINRTPSGATLDIIAFANADHTQRIKQKSGQTGRMWRIEDTASNELIVLDSVGNLQSGQPGFVSGLTGWRITPQGNAEFNNIWARGELHATVFVKDEVHATGGTLLVASAGTLHDDAVISATTVDEDTLVVYSTPAGMGVPLQVVTTSGTFVGTELHVTFLSNILNINDPPSGPGFYFQPGDVIRSKTEVATGVTDFWLEVNSATQNSGYASYSVTKRSGTDGTLPKGSAVVSYGREGDGRILLTSDLNYAPYIDVFTVGPNVWTGAAGSTVPRVRMGRLDGVGLPGVSGVTQYGMVAGRDLSDANSGYFIASDLQFSLYKIDIRLNNGTADTGLWTADGNLKIGSNVSALATTGFQVITTGARAGDVVIGNEATGNYLRWQQATGVLTVTGSLIIADPGTTVTKTYVDDADALVAANAVTGASNAQTNAQNYSDARRPVGVSGTWTSGVNIITWSGLSMMLANGGSRAINNGTTGTMAARTYLYINMNSGGPFSMGQTTNITTISSPNLVLIAVCDPGSVKASVSVVAGSTYISGSNIFTQSITANEIAANTITTGNLAAATITSFNTTAQGYANTAESNAAADATTKANNAGSAAQTYSDAHRVVAISGIWSSSGINQVSWTGVTIGFGDGSSKTVTDGSFTTVTGRRYIYIDNTAAAPLTLFQATLVSSLTATLTVVAVVDPGTTIVSGGGGKATITVVAGSTYISGDNILTGSISAANIAANTISANKLLVDTIGGASGINGGGVVNTGPLTVNGNLTVTNPGAITVGNLGNIKSTGKTAALSATKGFYLGYNSSTSNFDFNIGDDNSYLRWSSDHLIIRSTWPLQLKAVGAAQIIDAISYADDGRIGHIHFDRYNDLHFEFSTPLDVPELWITGNRFFSDAFGFRTSNSMQVTGNVTATGNMSADGYVFTNGNHMQIVSSRTPATSADSGNTGDFCWDSSYFYVRTSSGWRRIALGGAY